MGIKYEKFTISTNGFNDVTDITSKVQGLASDMKEQNGILNISVASSTASIITVEHEPGLIIDITQLLELIVPVNKVYQHDNVWHDGNAHAHLRATLLGHGVTIPFIDGKIETNNYQKIVLIDFDNKPRTRQITVMLSY